MPQHRHHVLIVGAGITGLLLAQCLKANNIPFAVFERDPDAYHRGRGWGLTIHWALDTLYTLLPGHLRARLKETFVDPEASARGDNGNFLFFDLRTAEARWKVPPAKRIRVSREKLRRLLMDGLDVEWSKSFGTFEVSADGSSVTAGFTDGTTRVGTLLVGCDGSRSKVREALFPDSHQNYQLPVRLLGASVVYPSSVVEPVRALDPFFFQGGDPETDLFHWFSFLDTPSNNERDDCSTYDCQIIVSWPYKSGFLGRETALEVPATSSERLALMKSLSNGWAEPFRSIIQRIPEHTEIRSTSLEDWQPPNFGSGMPVWNVVLVGDAAHAMTMFRGEAANHGIMDVTVLLENVLSLLKDNSGDVDAWRGAVYHYGSELQGRTAPAVLNSRQACLDAHDYENINDQSPLIAKRVALQK